MKNSPRARPRPRADRRIHWRCAAAGLAAALGVSTPVQADPILDLARETLGALQVRSFETGREFCAMMGVDATGALIVSKPRKGWRASCRPRDPRRAVDVIATLHTHGSHSPRYDSEVPSSNDLLGDMEGGLLGFVSTPGGRLWRLDGPAGTGALVCGAGCLPSDPDYDADDHDPVPARITLDILRTREGD